MGHLSFVFHSNFAGSNSWWSYEGKISSYPNFWWFFKNFNIIAHQIFMISRMLCNTPLPGLADLEGEGCSCENWTERARGAFTASPHFLTAENVCRGTMLVVSMQCSPCPEFLLSRSWYLQFKGFFLDRSWNECICKNYLDNTQK